MNAKNMLIRGSIESFSRKRICQLNGVQDGDQGMSWPWPSTGQLAPRAPQRRRTKAIEGRRRRRNRISCSSSRRYRFDFYSSTTSSSSSPATSFVLRVSFREGQLISSPGKGRSFSFRFPVSASSEGEI